MISAPRGCRVWMRKEQRPSLADGGGPRKSRSRNLWDDQVNLLCDLRNWYVLIALDADFADSLGNL